MHLDEAGTLTNLFRFQLPASPEQEFSTGNQQTHNVSNGATMLNYKKLKRETLRDLLINSEDQPYELCLEAVTRDGELLGHINEQTDELRAVAVSNYGWALKYIPIELWTPELVLMAVKQNGLVLAIVKDKTEEVCREAINQNKNAERFVK